MSMEVRNQKPQARMIAIRRAPTRQVSSPLLTPHFWLLACQRRSCTCKFARSGGADNRVVIGVVLAAALGAAAWMVVKLDLFGAREVPGQYQYKIDSIAEVEPNQILYKETDRPIETGFKHATAIAVDANGTVYAAGDHQVVVFNAGGQRSGTIALATDSTEEARPQCLAVVEGGGVLVGIEDRVAVYDAAGQEAGGWSCPWPDSVVTGIAVFKADVYVADAGHRTVLHYNREGRLLGRIGDKDASRGIDGFVVPSPHFDLAVPPDGLLRAVNPGRHRVEAYTPDGQMELSWGRFGTDVEGFTGCCNPVALAVLPDGGFVTAEKGVVRVKVFTPDGRFLGVVAGPRQLIGSPGKVCQTPEQCQSAAFDVAADSQGRIYVLDTFKNRIRIFEKKS
jgi:hypothetical protein